MTDDTYSMPPPAPPDALAEPWGRVTTGLAMVAQGLRQMDLDDAQVSAVARKTIDVINEILVEDKYVGEPLTGTRS